VFADNVAAMAFSSVSVVTNNLWLRGFPHGGAVGGGVQDLEHTRSTTSTLAHDDSKV
jgi:hypothetical protein